MEKRSNIINQNEIGARLIIGNKKQISMVKIHKMANALNVDCYDLPKNINNI